MKIKSCQKLLDKLIFKTLKVLVISLYYVRNTWWNPWCTIDCSHRQNAKRAIKDRTTPSQQL